MLACQYNQPQTARLLIKKGVSLDLVNNEGWSALMLACRYDQPETAQLLVKRKTKLDLVNDNGYSALHLACRYNQSRSAHLLLQQNVNLDLLNRNGWSALMFACRYDQPQTAQLLISKGAKLDLVTKLGWSVGMLACLKPMDGGTEHGMLVCLMLLYAAGANMTNTSRTTAMDQNVSYSKGSNALDFAKASGRLDALAFLEYLYFGPVAKVLARDLKFSRDIVLAFYKSDIHTIERCKQLGDSDLEKLGISKLMQRNEFQFHLEKKHDSIVKRVLNAVFCCLFE